MKLEDKIVLAHSGHACSKSKKIYKENSIEACRESSEKDYIDIIELDLRKSKDGILYCYHGTAIQYNLTLKLSRNFPNIEVNYKVDRLDDILDIIPKHKVVFLDIKDTSITKEEILKSFKKRDFKEIMIGNKSVSYLSKFNGLPKEFVKIINGNIFCNFYNLSKLKNNGYRYFEVVFPFQVYTKIIKKVEKNGLEFRISGLFFLSKESYWKKIDRYNIKYISSDFI